MTENADPQELSKFAELAHKWWDPESEFRPLHEINPLRLDWIEKTAGPLQGRQVIDVGCGGGILSEAMARKGARVLGIDLADKSLKVAELHAMESLVSGLRYRKVSAESLAAEQPASCDVVTCLEMLEHVPDPAAIVQACATLAKPGGWVFFSTINRNPKAYLMAVLGAEYVLHLLPRGTHDYQRFIRPSELASWCRDSALTTVASRGLGYNPFTRRYSLSDDVSVNFLIACRKAGTP